MNSHSKYIEEMATQALKRADCKNAPVSVEEVAKSFGLSVVEFAFHDKISGLLKKEQGVIGVNKNHPASRRRFTVAHELGHFLLGHGMESQEEIIDQQFNKPDSQEREANLFASSLLMPADLVKKEKNKLGLDVEKLAPVFGVSKQAITIRLLALKLI